LHPCSRVAVAVSVTALVTRDLKVASGFRVSGPRNAIRAGDPLWLATRFPIGTSLTFFRLFDYRLQFGREYGRKGSLRVRDDLIFSDLLKGIGIVG
jgi:hypothetical protein